MIVYGLIQTIDPLKIPNLIGNGTDLFPLVENGVVINYTP